MEAKGPSADFSPPSSVLKGRFERNRGTGPFVPSESTFKALDVSPLSIAPEPDEDVVPIVPAVFPFPPLPTEIVSRICLQPRKSRSFENDVMKEQMRSSCVLRKVSIDTTATPMVTSEDSSSTTTAIVERTPNRTDHAHLIQSAPRGPTPTDYIDYSTGIMEGAPRMPDF